MTSDFLSWAFQCLILSAGIYSFLRFLRTTRGSGLMRGIVLTLILGLTALAVLAKALDLLELEALIESFTPSIAVILVILFQPELRRIISQLGEQNRLGQLLAKGRDETISEVVQAITAMASRRVGALIAFERDFALDEYTHNAVKLDSAVNRLTIESIFHPGASLHDGAVVIRGDRIVAAACLFPLTENPELSKSVGTRHRAALGLTEETDAVTLTVSEETGRIAVFRRGKMQEDVAPQNLEKVLRSRLGVPSASTERDDEDPATTSSLSRAFGSLAWLFTQDVPRKLSAIALGALMVYVAHQEISQNQTFSMQVETTTGSSTEPQGGVLLVRLPSDEFHLRSPSENQFIQVEIRGSLNEIERLRGSVSGVLEVPADIADEPTDLAIDDIKGNWSKFLGLEVAWGSETPRLEIERFGSLRVALGPEHLALDLSGLNESYEVLLDEVDFTPDTIDVIGPAHLISQLGAGDLPLLLETIEFDADENSDREERLTLAADLRSEGFTVRGRESVSVRLPIAPVQRDIGSTDKEIAIIDLSVENGAASRRWELPALKQTARFRIVTVGIIPAGAEPGTPTWSQKTSEIRRFVEENLRVFVDTSHIVEGEGSAEVPVEWVWKNSWTEQLVVDAEGLDSRARLEVEIESDKRILLVERKASESPGDGDSAVDDSDEGI